MSENTRKLINKDGSVSIKDLTGAYVVLHAEPPIPEQTVSDVSIDNLLNAGLQNIRKAMKEVTRALPDGIPPDREVIQTLKDLMTMLRDLKKDEKDLLKDASKEQLEKLLAQ